MLPLIPILCASEMQRIDQLACQASADGALSFMEAAGLAIAQHLIHVLQPMNISKVIVFIGKGNKGGDALVAGRHLLNHQFQVIALLTHPLEACSPLSQRQGNRFVQAGGQLQDLSSMPLLHQAHWAILDGLLGTGARGAATGKILEAIEQINLSHRPTFSIDLPSGVDGDTGEVGSAAVMATQTLYLEFPKLGCFLGQGWNHTGQLIPLKFGLPEPYKHAIEVKAHWLASLPSHLPLPPLKRNQHKYEMGYVLGCAGESGLSGAPVLAGKAALRTGAGLVRIIYPLLQERYYQHREHDLIYSPCSTRLLKNEFLRAKAIYLGPGTTGKYSERRLCRWVLHKAKELPMVIDASLIPYLPNPLPSRCVITPHHKEFERLVGPYSGLSAGITWSLSSGATLLLKGGPTFIFHPKRLPLVVGLGGPALAKGGTGDVLTGIICALLARGLDPWEAALFGAAIHAEAGRLAEQALSAYSLMASDLLDYLPSVLRALLKDSFL